MELNIWTDPMLPLYLRDDVAVAILRNNAYYVAISLMLFEILYVIETHRHHWMCQ